MHTHVLFLQDVSDSAQQIQVIRVMDDDEGSIYQRGEEKKGCVRGVMGQQRCLLPISSLWRHPSPRWCLDCSVCPAL